MKQACRRPPYLVLASLLLVSLGCGVIGFVENPAPLAGLAYWAAETATPRPTVTVFLGMTTPVYPDTPTPAHTGTTTPVPPWTTTPALPLIGFTTPEPTQTPYYRVGTFYLNSDVYIGGPNGLVVAVTGHQTQPSPHNPEATYHYLTIHVTNFTGDSIVVPLSDLFFIRQVVGGGGEVISGRWVAQNEPLLAEGLPAYDTQQLEPLAENEGREYILGFVTPNGAVNEAGLITNWQRPVEGGLPIWFLLEDDPLGPFVDAYQPPPPTPAVLDDPELAGWPGPGTPVVPGLGMWPTTGIITRSFGCHEDYTGIDGAGWGCPAGQPWFHNGVDIANSSGTLVWSPMDGAILYAGPHTTGPDCSDMDGSEPPHNGLGNYQRVGDMALLHYFGHLSSFLISAGAVTAGQPVAEMGSSGCSTGPHLHWTLYQGGSLLDPAAWAGPGPSP